MACALKAYVRGLPLCLVVCLLTACAPAGLPAENPEEHPKERAPMAPVIVQPAAEQWQSRVVQVNNVGLMGPASVVHDSKTDTYLISNVNGSPFAKDNNGFISKLNPDGRLVSLEFIASGKNQVTLHAPKGMVISDRTLYVADLDAVKGFDLDTGAFKGTIEITGAQCLSDLALAPDGTLFVSDSGLKEGFVASGTDAVYRIDPEQKVHSLATGTSLGGPTGLIADAEGVWGVTLSGDLFRLGKDGSRVSSQKGPALQLAGIAMLADKSLLISSWECGCIYRGTPAGAFTKVAENVPSAAGIAHDSVRNRILVPLPNSHAFEAHSLPQ